MNKSKITIEIDQNDLASYTDSFLQSAWFVAQANPADINDQEAGALAEAIGREIISRWLKAQSPELWRHQGRHHYWGELIKHGQWYNEGKEYRPHGAVFAESVALQLRRVAGMDPADSRIPQSLAQIRADAEKLSPAPAAQPAASHDPAR
jgi:hypothetical protein